jgi:NADPH-dependent 2,4-dienoyl-CoA reductase/sulfur reductase-like enzyme
MVCIDSSGAAVTAERLVVIGGGPAALEAARAYREGGAGGEAVLVSADEYLPYNRPPLSKDFLRGDSEEDASGRTTTGSDRDRLRARAGGTASKRRMTASTARATILQLRRLTPSTGLFWFARPSQA